MVNQIQLEVLKIIKRDENKLGSVNAERLKKDIAIKNLKISKKELQKYILELNQGGYIYESKPQEWRYLG